MSDTTLNWSKWLLKSRFDYMSPEQKEQTLKWLLTVRDAVLHNANIRPTDTVIDIGTGTGLLAFGAFDFINENGKVIFSDKFEDCLSVCKSVADELKISKPYEMVVSDCADIKLPSESVDRALTRSVLVHILDKKQAFSEIHRILKPEGVYSAFEPVIRSNTRCWELVQENELSDYADFKRAEDECLTALDDPLSNFDENTVAQDLDAVGFSDGIVDKQVVESNYAVQPGMVETWLTTPPSPGAKTMKEKFLTYFEEPKVENYMKELQQALDNRMVTIKSNVLYIRAVK